MHVVTSHQSTIFKVSGRLCTSIVDESAKMLSVLPPSGILKFMAVLLSEIPTVYNINLQVHKTKTWNKSVSFLQIWGLFPIF